MRSGRLGLFLILLLAVCASSVRGQQTNVPVPGAPVTLQNAPQRDTSKKTNTSEWKDEQTRVYFRRNASRVILFPDTQLHHFHRRPFTQPWQRDLGNLGSPVTSLLFTPEYRTGPTLGYHAFDPYMFHVDSLNYYNTTRPYSAFTFQLGSKAEQLAEILHTQNINPAWNFVFNYRKITSPGHYRIQRNNHDLGNINTNYLSNNQQYRLNAALVYNKLQHDENGGITADSFLRDESFDDRATIPVFFQNDAYSIRRSGVTNNFRDIGLLLSHSFTWGNRDTLYSTDSTQIIPKLTPRFSIGHRLHTGSQKLQFKDLIPDSLRYGGLITEQIGATDSVFMAQKWFFVNNEVTLNSFFGPLERQFQFSAGIGNRFDRFATDYGIGEESSDEISNYLTGTLRKEALQPQQWTIDANAQLYLTGVAAGNLRLSATISKQISERIGAFTTGFQQNVNNAPYNYTVYRNRYFDQRRDFDKESITQFYGLIRNKRLGISAGARNYILANYIYLNQSGAFSQRTSPFNISQVWLSKVFYFGHFVLDNEATFQNVMSDGPVNLPALAGRNQLSYETYVFGNALKIATGIDIRWHTAYDPAGYNPFYNRFFFQEGYRVSNYPEAAVFFNFKVKNFRAYLMGDQLQHMFTTNNIAAPGYPTQDPMIRFGFNWVMVN